MKVIHFLGEYIGNGGIESFVTNILGGMHQHNIESIVVAYYHIPNVYEHYMRINGAEIVYLHTKRINVIHRINMFARYLKKHANSDDILHLHTSTSGGYMYAFVAYLCGLKRIVFHLHNIPAMDPNQKLWRTVKNNIIDTLLNWVPQVKIACSKEAGYSFFKQNEFKLVHNGIDFRRFSFDYNARERLRKQMGMEGKFVIGQVGRLAYQKNQEFTLSLIKRAKQQGIDCYGVLVGSGTNRENLEEYVRINNMTDLVNFVDPTEKIQEYYSAFDLFVFPSIYEGLGISALEAQAAGLPVICSENISNEVFVTDMIFREWLSEQDNWIKRIKFIKEMSVVCG